MPSTFHRLPWIVRACAAGLAASALSAAIGTLVFVALPRATTMNWTWLAPAIVVFAIVGGLSLGLGLGAGTMLGRRSPGRLVLGGALGGAVAAIPPGILGIAGFGAQAGPYFGTANIVGTSLVCTTVFVALWAPRVVPGSGPRTGLGRIGLAAVAALVAALSFAALGGSLVAALDLEPSFTWLRDTARDMGLVSFSIVAAAALGAAFGALVGAAIGVYASLTAVVGSRRRDAR